MLIRKAGNTQSDCKLAFSLSNDMVVRANSFNQGEIKYSNHCGWFERTVADKNVLFFLVFADDTENDFIGQIRFRRDSEDSTECVISLSIAELFRGKHIAGQFMELGIEEMRRNWTHIDTVKAEVKDGNIPSNKLFRSEGFELTSRVNMYKLKLTKVMGGGTPIG